MVSRKNPGSSNPLPSAPSRFGIKHVEDLLTPDEQTVLRDDLTEIANTRYRNAGALATHLFGEDDGNPVLTHEQRQRSLAEAMGAGIARARAIIAGNIRSNYVDVEGTNPDTVILSYGSGEDSFTLEA